MPEDSQNVPSYLGDYAGPYARDPRAAAARWFRDAKFGLFVHYGLYSLEGRHEWLQHRELIPVAEYAKLKDRFAAEKFDADAIADLALAAEMKYVNLTTRHHDSFCLFRTDQTDFNSVESPAGRDLVADLAEACRRKGLGLCLYYSHGRDWRHPHAPNNDQYNGARPPYDPPDPHYAYGDEHDLGKYLAFVKAQITELLTQYGPVAAIWLDGIGTPLHPKGPDGEPIRDFDPTRDGDAFDCQALYDHIHALQPQCLVSYKQGYLGTEDFFAPEHKFTPRTRDDGKPREICSTLQEHGWGWFRGQRHRTADEAWGMVTRAHAAGCNLLLNTGPRDDGSILLEDAETLRELGRRLRGS